MLILLGFAALVALVFAWPWLVALADPVLAACDRALDRIASRRLRDTPAALPLLSPAMLILGAFGLAPIVYALYLSLFRVRGISWQYIGAQNYTSALGTEEFWDSFLHTVYYAAGTIPATLVFSFFVASLLFHIVRGRSFFRTVYFLPYITAIVAAATVWRALLHPREGVVNKVLALAGVEGPAWLLEYRGVLHLLTGGLVPEDVGPSLALCCIILFEIWHSSGFMIVIFLAGFTALPRELEEAARIDGANYWQLMRRVRLPLLSPTIFFLVIVSSIKAFQAFNSFYAMTGDGAGPLNTTQNMTVYIYRNFYVYGKVGYGAAVAALLAVAIVALTVVQWRYVGRKVHYE